MTTKEFCFWLLGFMEGLPLYEKTITYNHIMNKLHETLENEPDTKK